MKNFQIAYRMTPDFGFDPNSRKIRNRYGLHGSLFKHLDGEIELEQYLKSKVGEDFMPKSVVRALIRNEQIINVDRNHNIQYSERLLYYAAKDLLDLTDMPMVVGYQVFANWIVDIMRESSLNQFVVFPTRIYLVDAYQSPSVNDWLQRVREKFYATGELNYGLDDTPYTDAFSTVRILGNDIDLYSEKSDVRAWIKDIHIRDDFDPNALPPFFKVTRKAGDFVNSATKTLLESRGIKAVRFDDLEYAAIY